MGQSLDSMAQNQSKDEVLYQMAITGNVDAIKALCSEGANLEWIDKEGKTPLIVACMDSGLYNVAKVLIEMGANVNAYRPANALARNDDCQTALDVARTKGNLNVVRIIESHMCYFSGWLREFYGPGFLRAFAPHLLSRKIWTAVIPQGSRDPMKPIKLELVVYPTSQDAQPRTIIALWEAKIEEPNFNQPDPGLTIFDQSTKTQYKLASANEGDKQQLHWFYDACSGIPQVIPPPMHCDPPTAVPVVVHQTSAEAVELAMAVSGSIHSATEDKLLHPNTLQSSGVINANGWEDPVRGDSHYGWAAAVASTHSAASSSGWMDEAPKEDCNGWGLPNMGPSGSQGHVQTHDDIPPVFETSGGNTASVSSAPSAPPIPDGALDEGPIHHPSIDFSKVDLSVPAAEHGASVTSDVNDGGTSSCIICWEAPVEGACIPCGQMAGCMTCLNDIKAKKGVCPVCRSKINQIVRLYAV